MLSLGWVEMMVIAVVMILIIGPRDLPKVLHTLGQWVGQMRAVASHFQENIEAMARESGVRDLQKEFQDLERLDPVRTLREPAADNRAAQGERVAEITDHPPTKAASEDRDASQPPETRDEPGPESGRER